jgi:NADH dehydrogenase
MNLIVGATGMVGSEICRLLAAEGKPVRGLVRVTCDQSKVEALENMGVELASGDVRDRASLDAACQGVQSIISTVSAMPFSHIPGENDCQTVDLEGVKNLIDAAKAAGVQHFVYTSFSRQLACDFPLGNAKRAVEQYLKESGLTYTILHPSFFMEVWLSPAVGFDAASGQAQIYGTGENPISWISFQDVARFAVASLEAPAARNAVIEMGGPQALSPLEVVRIFEQASGKSFAVQHVPVEALVAQQEAAADAMEQSFPALMRCYAQGDPIDMSETLEALPLQLKSVEEYAESVYG